MISSQRAIWVLALAGSMWAAENPAPVGSSDDAITAAKKDFERVKAARDAVAPAQGGLPQLATPEIQVESSGPEAWLKKQNELERAKKRKSANWLIDAMEEEKRRGTKSGTGSRDDFGRDRDTELLATRPDSPNATTMQETAAETAAKADEKEGDARPKPAVSNPLAPFMSDWMTPQDLALLQAPAVSGAAPTVGGVVANPTEPAGSQASTAAPTTGTWEASLGVFGAGANKNPAGSGATARDNPFLQNSAGGESLNGAFSPPVMTPPPSSPPPAPSIFTAPPVEPASARSSIPDFLRPSEDAKAFKPMKRF